MIFSELDLRAIQLLSKYKETLSNLRYHKRKSEEEIYHEFSWETDENSTKTVNFYESKSGYLMFDSDDVPCRFNLEPFCDDGIKMVKIDSTSKVFDIIEYLIGIKTK